MSFYFIAIININIVIIEYTPKKAQEKVHYGIISDKVIHET